MKKSEVKIGQRVELSQDFDCAKRGMVGEVVCVSNGTFKSIGVAFDKPFSGGHNLGGRCSHDCGHWVSPESIELIKHAYTTKYKPGDVVKVRSDLKFGYYKMATGGDPMRTTDQMLTKRGKTVKIKSVTKTGKYMIEGSIFPWVDEMFEDKTPTKPTNPTKSASVVVPYIIGVVFPNGGTVYKYLSETKYSVGDNVTVPCGTCDTNNDVKVVEVKEFDINRLPVPLSKMKWVIGKSEKPAEPKFKVGDKVRVRKDLKRGNRYLMEHNDYGDTVVSEMCGMRGIVVTIKSINSSGSYRIHEFGYNWTDGMFEDKPVTGYCGKVVFIGRGGDSMSGFTLGKIYEFVDGRTKDDDGDYRPMGRAVYSLDDDLVKNDFIEIVE